MKEERDVLVKRTFPQLRKICEERDITWGEVDLRWGITEEQKAEGKVPPIRKGSRTQRSIAGFGTFEKREREESL